MKPLYSLKIDEYLKKTNTNATKLCKEFNIPYQTFSRWRRGIGISENGKYLVIKATKNYVQYNDFDKRNVVSINYVDQ